MLMQTFLSRWSQGFCTHASEPGEDNSSSVLSSVKSAIGDAISKLQAERDGLDVRIKEIHAITSIAVGTESDEYLTREPGTTAALQRCEAELRSVRASLAIVDEALSRVSVVRAAFEKQD